MACDPPRVCLRPPGRMWAGLAVGDTPPVWGLRGVAAGPVDAARRVHLVQRLLANLGPLLRLSVRVSLNVRVDLAHLPTRHTKKNSRGQARRGNRNRRARSPARWRVPRCTLPLGVWFRSPSVRSKARVWQVPRGVLRAERSSRRRQTVKTSGPATDEAGWIPAPFPPVVSPRPLFKCSFKRDRVTFT